MIVALTIGAMIYMIILYSPWLFVQANADLALPDYLSQIVNIGIQAGGVENAVPLAIRALEMNRLVLFLSAEDTPRVLKSYTLVDPASPDANLYLSQYPVLLDTEPVYVRKTLDQDQIDLLNPIMGRGMLVVSPWKRAMADPEKAAAMGQGSSGLDLSKLPPGWICFRCWASCLLTASSMTRSSTRNLPPWATA